MGHDGFSPARPFIHIILGAFCAHPPFDGIEPQFRAQLQQPVGLGLWGDVTLHGTGVGAQLAGFPPQQGDHGLLLLPAPQIPQGCIQTCQRTAAVAAGELMLFALNMLHQTKYIVAIGTQRPGGDLPVKNLCRDIGIVGRCLAPAKVTVVCRYPDKADEIIGEGFKANDPGHGSCFLLVRHKRHLRVPT